MYIVYTIFQVIKYLRKEKDIAVARLDIIIAERDRLKHQADVAEKQLEEAQVNIVAEREKAQVGGGRIL